MNRQGNGGEFHIVWRVVTLSLVSRCHLTETDVLLVLQAISNPRSDDHQDRAWQSVVPLVSQLKQYYDFSISLGNSDAVIQSGTEKKWTVSFCCLRYVYHTLGTCEASRFEFELDVPIRFESDGLIRKF